VSAPGLTVLSGDDGLTLPFISVGAAGVVSVVSNLFPRHLVALVAAARAGNVEKARQLHAALWPAFKGAFIETNPVPIKRALAQQRVIDSDAVRLPLVQLEPSNAAKWTAVVAALVSRPDWDGLAA
jgi:4-hydroxy-tetrahydrodipicolinate synthase